MLLVTEVGSLLTWDVLVLGLETCESHSMRQSRIHLPLSPIAYSQHRPCCLRTWGRASHARRPSVRRPRRPLWHPCPPRTAALRRLRGAVRREGVRKRSEKGGEGRLTHLVHELGDIVDCEKGRGEMRQCELRRSGRRDWQKCKGSIDPASKPREPVAYAAWRASSAASSLGRALRSLPLSVLDLLLPTHAHYAGERKSELEEPQLEEGAAQPDAVPRPRMTSAAAIAY